MLLVLIALDDELVRWCVTTDQTTRSTVAITRLDLSRRMASYSLSILDPSSNDWAEQSTRLSEWLLEPLAASIPNRLLLVTDAEIASVPFATLKIPGRPGLVADTTEIVVLASQGPIAPATRRLRRTLGNVLVVGDPAIHPSNAVLPRLPGAMAEAQEVAALYPAATVVLGPHATKAAFLATSPGADIVHFAGHAMGNRADPAMSRLLLAGINGDLTASDVLGLRLGARLVVLGACEGALAAKAGDSPVFGLAQAFLHAGVAAVVASRWQVADGSARQLLVRFHRHIVRGETPAGALRAAQAELRTEPNYRHPFYWAGFAVYVGTA
jgi:CHAT domain-containing protein